MSLAGIFHVAVVLAAWNPGVDWQKEVTRVTPGLVPPPPPAVLRYSFGWAGIAAGQAKVTFKIVGPAFIAVAEGGSIGMARSLWKFDTLFRSETSRATFKPIRLEQTETLRTKKTVFNAEFGPKIVEAKKLEESGGKTEVKERKFRFEGTYDLLSAYLYLRTLPWKPGDEATVVLFPVFSPYLIYVKALGKERIKIAAGEFDAIKFSLEARKIGRKKSLEPFKKLKKATIWMSDDADRLILKSDVEIFVGSIFAELTKFEESK